MLKSKKQNNLPLGTTNIRELSTHHIFSWGQLEFAGQMLVHQEHSVSLNKGFPFELVTFPNTFYAKVLQWGMFLMIHQHFDVSERISATKGSEDKTFLSA